MQFAIPDKYEQSVCNFTIYAVISVTKKQALVRLTKQIFNNRFVLSD
jgi:hypothetical protein